MDLERVYREQYRSLVGFILKRTGDRARAEEIAQEAFVRAIRQQPRHPRSWLYAVAANLVRDDARRHATQARHLRLVQATEPAGPTIDPTVDLARATDRDRVRDALASLSERDRSALLLKEEGLSYEEIAERLGLSQTSVGTTLCRARKRLVSAWQSGKEAATDATTR